MIKTNYKNKEFHNIYEANLKSPTISIEPSSSLYFCYNDNEFINSDNIKKIHPSINAESNTSQFVYSNLNVNSIRIPDNISIFENVISKINVLKDKNVINNVLEFISIFNKLLIEYSKEFEDINLPNFIINEDEDNAAILEWVLKDTRIGFIIENDFNESLWYIVTNENSEKTIKSGDLNKENIYTNLKRILMFILKIL